MKPSTEKLGYRVTRAEGPDVHWQWTQDDIAKIAFMQATMGGLLTTADVPRILDAIDACLTHRLETYGLAHDRFYAALDDGGCHVSFHALCGAGTAEAPLIVVPGDESPGIIWRASKHPTAATPTGASFAHACALGVSLHRELPVINPGIFGPAGWRPVGDNVLEAIAAYLDAAEDRLTKGAHEHRVACDALRAVLLCAGGSEWCTHTAARFKQRGYEVVFGTPEPGATLQAWVWFKNNPPLFLDNDV